MKIAIYNRRAPDGSFLGKKDNQPQALDDLEWADLADLLEDEAATDCAPCLDPKNCAAKNRMSWSPVEIAGTRANENVVAMTALVFDLDHITDAEIARVDAQLEGYAAILHSTHSHRPPDDGCYRLVLKLSRPVRDTEAGGMPFNDFWRAVREVVIGMFALPADPSCKDLSRLYFLPSIAAGLPSTFGKTDGATLDADLLVHMARSCSAVSIAVRDPIEPTREDLIDLPPCDSIDLATLRERLRQVRYRKARGDGIGDRERHAILDRILKGEALAAPGFRNPAIHQAMAIIACSLPEDTPWDAAIELIRPSIMAMDLETQGGKGVAHALDVAEDSYRRRMAHRIARDKEWEARTQAMRERLRGLALKPAAGQLGAVVTLALPATPIAPAELPGVSDAALPAGATDPAESLDWKELILRNQKGQIFNVGENIFVILGFSEDTRDTIRFNVVKKQIEVFGGPFDKVPQSVLKTEITDWLQRFWQLTYRVDDVKQRILRVARSNDFDPLADFLSGLKWDGIDRLSTFLETYVGARCVNAGGVDITNYVRSVGRKFMVSLAARGLDPGCKVDTVLVLEGKQGRKKSQFFEILGGDWYCSDELVLGAKDSMMLAGRCWLIELAECASLRKSETNSQKAFLSRRTDLFRPPYGESLEESPRRCVFVGSTNDEFYLADRTGNRRWWPIVADRIDLERFRLDRDQLLAQAVAEYLEYKRHAAAGVAPDDNPCRWWLVDSEQEEADAQTRERVQESAIEQKIAAWWLGMKPGSRPGEFNALTIAETVLRLDTAQIVSIKGLETQIGIAMKSLGFDKRRRAVGGIDGYFYIPTDRLRDAPQGARSFHLTMIAGAKAS